MLEERSITATLVGTVGLPFTSSRPSATTVELQLADGQDAARTFAILVSLTGRQLQIRFRPGRWAGDLVREMGRADDEGRRIFADLISRCVAGGAGRVAMSVNGSPVDPVAVELWPSEWQLLDITFDRPRVAIDAYDRDAMGLEAPDVWVARFGSALAALLPLEETAAEQFEPDIEGDPVLVTHFTYERSRRNRAAAIAIHGYDCRACMTNMAEVYGAMGAGFIHVHHETSLADLGGAREVDPYSELVPLCPNCHAIAHRRRPAYTIDEIRQALAEQRAAKV